MNKPELDIDFQLIERLRKSDRQSFNLIYDKYCSQLLKACLRRIPDKDVCNDIINDLFLTLWENREKASVQNLKAYLFQSLRFKIIDYIRHKSKSEDLFQDYLYQLQREFIGTDYEVRTKLLQEVIQKEIDSFPIKMKQVFIMSRHEYLSHSEIANKLGISEQTVRSHMKHALKRLRLRLSLIIIFLFLFTP